MDATEKAGVIKAPSCLYPSYRLLAIDLLNMTLYDGVWQSDEICWSLEVVCGIMTSVSFITTSTSVEGGDDHHHHVDAVWTVTDDRVVSKDMNVDIRGENLLKIDLGGMKFPIYPKISPAALHMDIDSFCDVLEKINECPEMPVELSISDIKKIQ